MKPIQNKIEHIIGCLSDAKFDIIYEKLEHITDEKGREPIYRTIEIPIERVVEHVKENVIQKYKDESS